MLETLDHTPAPAAASTQRSVSPGPAQPNTAPTPHGLSESAELAVQSVGHLYTALDVAVSKHVRENPYATLAAAAGVGFVLGGGMRSPIGQVLLRLSVRAFGPPLVSAALHNAAERAQALT
jgi:hypothetical protein